jgi:hypothetical protein
MLLAGCSSIDHVKVEGWPALEVVERYVPKAELHARCSEYVSTMWVAPVACAQFDFVNARCYVWYSADEPPSAATIAHERLHCQGYDHVGDTTLRDLMRRQGEPR